MPSIPCTSGCRSKVINTLNKNPQSFDRRGFCCKFGSTKTQIYMAKVRKSKEEWLPVPGFLNLQASDGGNLRLKYKWGSTKVKEFNNTKRYRCCHLFGKHYLSHRLIGLAWHPNPLNKKFINHKNGIKWDNRPVNIEWCTDVENKIHSAHVLDNDTQWKKRKVCILIQGVKIAVAPSVRMAAKLTGVPSSNVSKQALGKRKQCSGFTFFYVDFVYPNVLPLVVNRKKRAW